jgi:integrase
MITKWSAVKGKKGIRSRKNNGRSEYQARKRVGDVIKEGPVRNKVWDALKDLDGFKVQAAMVKASVQGGETGFGPHLKSYLNNKASADAKKAEEDKWSRYIVPFLVLNDITEPWHFTESKVEDWVRHLEQVTWSRPGSKTTSPLRSYSKGRLTAILWGVLREGKRKNSALVIPKKPRFEDDSQSLNRDLTPAKIRSVFNEAPGPPQPHRAILAVIFRTGMGADVLKWKRNRILGPITPETLIVVSRSKTGHSKTTKVPLGELAAKELLDLGVDEYGPDEYLFKSLRKPGDHIKDIKGFLRGQARRLKLATLPLHAFRHAFATFGREEGVDAITLAQILGHSDLKMIHKVYDHSQIDREVLDSVSNKMQGKVSGDVSASHITIPTQFGFKILHSIEKQDWNLACEFARFFPYGVEEYRNKLQ